MTPGSTPVPGNIGDAIQACVSMAAAIYFVSRSSKTNFSENDGREDYEMFSWSVLDSDALDSHDVSLWRLFWKEFRAVNLLITCAIVLNVAERMTAICKLERRYLRQHMRAALYLMTLLIVEQTNSVLPVRRNIAFSSEDHRKPLHVVTYIYLNTVVQYLLLTLRLSNCGWSSGPRIWASAQYSGLTFSALNAAVSPFGARSVSYGLRTT